MNEYFAQAVSRNDLRQLAYIMRREFGYSDVWYIPVDKMLDQMCDKFEGFSYEIIPDDEWEDGSAHASTDVIEGTIKIRESIYSRACDGEGRDRMTIVHEIAHYILICVLGIKLYSRKGKDIETYKDPEWQAKCLAGEFLIPYNMLKEADRMLTSAEISDRCGVSLDAARYQRRCYMGGDYTDFSKQKH